MKRFKNQKTGRILALVLSSSLLLAGCGSAESTVAKTEVADIVVDMQEAKTGNLTLQNSFVGTVSPQEQVYVIPFASGKVTEVNYNVGDHVNAGDVLFKIDDESAQLQLTQAQLSATSAKQQVDMANGATQKSTDLQLQGAQVQAQSGFEQAEIAYVKVKDAYDDLDDMEDRIEEIQEEIEEAMSVSGGNGTNIAELQQEMVTLQTTLATMAKSGVTKDSLKTQLQQAESAYEAAKEGLEISNASAALTQGEIRQSTKEQTQTSLALAQLGVDGAELALSYYTVTAPISGVIQSRNVEVNGMAGSGSPAFTIANENTMTVTFQVSESVMKTFQVGDAITVERGGTEYVGYITEVGVAVNMQTGLFQVKASVEADGSVLPSGVSVKLTADTYEAQNAILIPYDAVYYDMDGAYVYLCVDGKATKTYVTTDIFDDTTIAIVEGINAGDTVITSWSPNLLDGAAVTASDAVAK
ncbi:MAG: efflux RND transporter periplasmic adaptor subunit [Lachnospiraceae bacterium]|nr:efflux RND transporter periplasmic adaptor subunit [Lachnospiraceae bacterium]